MSALRDAADRDLLVGRRLAFDSRLVGLVPDDTNLAIDRFLAVHPLFEVP